MAENAYKVTTLNLFEDLKKTNIKHEDFKQILSSYQQLATSYIKDNQADLYKDLNKQKNVIFSYLTSLKREDLKKVASLSKKLEAELGNIDDIDTCEDPEKQVQFIKVAFNNGKWTISAHNFEDTEFTKKETPEAINCLVNLVNRLDEQEAAYALCHARKAGLFVMAALPYVRTEDFTNTALEQRYSKDPGTVLGPVEHSWNSTTDNTNMPVSRQKAALGDEEVKEMDTFVDKDGDQITISSISSDAVITFDNDIYTKEEVEENIQSGYWTKIESAKEDIKLKRLEKEAESLIEAYKKKLIINEAAQRVADSVMQKIEDVTKAQVEAQDEIEASVEPRLKKIAAKIDAITFKDNKVAKKLQRLRHQIGSLVLNYSRPVEEFQKRVVPVEKVEEILDQMRNYLSPKNLNAFNELAEQLFQFSSRAESFSVTLTNKDPKNEELIEEQMKKIHKQIKTSQNDAFVKDKVYNALDRMLIAGQIDFNQYNTLSDFAEMDSKLVLESVKTIRAGFVKVQADTKGIGQKIKDLFNSVKSWIMDKLSFLSIQEKQITDIDEELDSIIPEGE